MIGMGLAAAMTVHSGARAQDAEETGAQEAATPIEQEKADDKADDDKDSKSERSSKAGDDGMRFRFGVAAGAGPLLVKDRNASVSYSPLYGGVDLRFGVQINDLLGVYVQPQMGYYNIKDAGSIGGGLLGASLGADATFVHRFFVGAGVGYAVLNNPSGVELHFRAGGYPLMGRSTKNVRRKGLMLGIDFRVHMVGNEMYKLTGIAPTFNLGYEAF